MRQPVDNRVPTRGGVGRSQGSSRRSSKHGGYGNILPKKPPNRVFPAAGDSKDRRRETVPLLRLRHTSVMRSITPRPHGRRKLSHGWRLLASAVPQHCFPAVRRQLQHPRPSADPSVPFFAKNISLSPPPPLRRKSICEYLVAEKTYRKGRAGDPCAGVRILCFSKTLRVWLPDSR
jgi:hypothetical protein